MTNIFGYHNELSNEHTSCPINGKSRFNWSYICFYYLFCFYSSFKSLSIFFIVSYYASVHECYTIQKYNIFSSSPVMYNHHTEWLNMGGLLFVTTRASIIFASLHTNSRWFQLQNLNRFLVLVAITASTSFFSWITFRWWKSTCLRWLRSISTMEKFVNRNDSLFQLNLFLKLLWDDHHRRDYVAEGHK